jgi:hypothetical protein
MGVVLEKLLDTQNAVTQMVLRKTDCRFDRPSCLPCVSSMEFALQTPMATHKTQSHKWFCGKRTAVSTGLPACHAYRPWNSHFKPQWPPFPLLPNLLLRPHLLDLLLRPCLLNSWANVAATNAKGFNVNGSSFFTLHPPLPHSMSRLPFHPI